MKAHLVSKLLILEKDSTIKQCFQQCFRLEPLVVSECTHSLLCTHSLRVSLHNGTSWFKYREKAVKEQSMDSAEVRRCRLTSG